MQKSVLVTGGTGYIGSHTAAALYSAGYKKIIVLDNLSNSDKSVLEKLKMINGEAPVYYGGDLRDKPFLKKIFAENDIEGVLHFAGLKAVGESVEKPLLYYENNIYGTVVLLEAMKEAGIKKFIFSSSATVYGETNIPPYTEEMPLPAFAVSPYGSTKLYIENILKDLFRSDNSFNIIILRYFNPVGAHSSALIGENPRGIPNNLTPYIARVVFGQLKEINVFGGDYPTSDGTGVRDYIHIEDLAEGHVLAYKKINAPGVHIYNLGSGKGNSVMEVIKAFEKAAGKKLPYKICARRLGDIAAFWADASKAEKELGFKVRRSLDDMCSSLLKFQENLNKTKS